MVEINEWGSDAYDGIAYFTTEVAHDGQLYLLTVAGPDGASSEWRWGFSDLFQREDGTWHANLRHADVGDDEADAKAEAERFVRERFGEVVNV